MKGIGSDTELEVEVAWLSDVNIAPFVKIPFSWLELVKIPLWMFPLVKIPLSWFPLVKIPLWMFPFVIIETFPPCRFPLVKIPMFPLWRFAFAQNRESPSDWPTRTTWCVRGLKTNQYVMVHNKYVQLFEEIDGIMSYNSQIYLDFVFVLPRNNVLLSEIILLLWRGWQEKVFSTSRYERHFLVRIKIWCPVILLMVRIKIRFPAILLMAGWNHFPISRRRFSQSNLLLVVFKVSDLQQFDQLITPND